jgi:dihydropteroate synthase
MIRLQDLAHLAATYADDIDRPVAPFTVAGRVFDTDDEPVIMGVVNLSRDSTYRESIATSTASGIRKARTQAAQGAHLVDIGAESSRASAELVSPEEQAVGVIPVIEQLAADGIRTSIEGYDTTVVRAGLKAGASVVNLTGSHRDDEMFTLAAEHDAALVLCHVLGQHARDLDGSDVEADPIPTMIDTFGSRIERARELGVRSIAVDPGLGFGFRLADQRSRAQHQTAALVNTFRLRSLGVPVCHAMPHAFDVFEDQFRSAEGVFAVLAHLGRTGIYRVHEVPLVRAVLDAMTTFTVDGV